MRKMVFDVPAESGGALSVLYDFYDDYKTDMKNEYIFVVSKPDILETKNIKVLRFPWIKKSWFHRIFFDHIIAPKLIRKFNVDEVLSLQNIMIPHTKTPQTVYLHNALPFAEHRFSFFPDKLLWIYQNVLSKRIFNSMRKVDEVIVQTEWMKNACVNKVGINEKKIKILPPKININVKNSYRESKESLITFFYPASGAVFKNHKVIVEACLKLKEENIYNYRVIFTLNGNEYKHIAELHKQTIKQNLPIEFIGNLSREEVFDYYSKSILIFPSYIETVGLPLIEARLHGTPIIVSDSNFSKPILESYNFVDFFKYNDSENLRQLMIGFILKGMKEREYGF